MATPSTPDPAAGRPVRPLRLVGVTACPTGIAHTYMAAEKLVQTAARLGHEMRVETQGSIGTRDTLTDAEIAAADGVIIAADTDIDQGRFAGKPLVVASVSQGISAPEALIAQVAAERGSTGAEPPGAAAPPAADGGLLTAAATAKGRRRGKGYTALMTGVSHMIPFVATGGLLIAVSLSLGGEPTPEGLQIPEGSIWATVNTIGTLAFMFMVPVLSAYIAYAIADRPGLVPGLLGGYVAANASLYGAGNGPLLYGDGETSAGFIGAIITGFLAGYVALGIARVPVPKFVMPIMPIIVIPILSTLVVVGLFIAVLGAPIAWVFSTLTGFLGGLQGASAALLGVIIGLMIAFDMGGPVNKTAFLFGAGLISEGNLAVMGMAAAAIAVPPLGMGAASLVRRTWFAKEEREAGYAALFMGFFGITEGAIPFAAGRPGSVIPANMAGGAVAACIAAVAGVGDSVAHGGPIVALLGAVDGIAMFFVAVVAGSAVTAGVALGIMALDRRRTAEPVPAAAGTAPGQGGGAGGVPVPRAEGVAAVRADGAPRPAGTATAEAPAATGSSGRPIAEYLDAGGISVALAATERDPAIEEMAALAEGGGRVLDRAALVRALQEREAQMPTALGPQVAIPHAKCDAVSAPVLAFGRSAGGIAWPGSAEGPVRLVFLIAVPESMSGDEHLRVLAALSRRLVDDGYRARLGTADASELRELLAQIG